MTQENVEAARALVKLWNEGTRSVPTEYFDPAVELESPFSSLVGEPYRGHAGIERWVHDVDEQFSEWRIHLEDVREVGSTVIIIARLHGRGRASGIQFDQPSAVVMDFVSAGRVTRMRIYADVSEALKAVGLEE